MKTTSGVVVLVVFVSIGLLTVGFAGDVKAAASDGVRCPNGYETRFDSTQKTMRCERNTPVYRPTVCDAATPEFLVYRSVKGRDFCVKAVDAAAPANGFSEHDTRKRMAACIGDTGETLRWQIELDAQNERDRCRATRMEWIYPSQQ
jgi:hypothetical protein